MHRVFDAAPVRIAALLTCHNRRSLTLRCLDSLAIAAGMAAKEAVVDVYLVDDGCTDATSDAVRDEFPDVHIISGDGNLYWCGGMRLAWSQAAISDYDAYLWLNDDVTLDGDAILQLLAVAERFRRSDGAVIVVGATRGDGGNEVTYGGLGSKGVIAPTGMVQRIEIFNGNIVLVSRRAYHELGGLASAYTHGLGDIDYGIRAKRAGIPALLTAGSLGSCAANTVARWQRSDLPLLTRLRELHRPTGCPPWQLARLIWSNGGWWFPWSVFKLYLSVLFPRGTSERP